jgi:hypothetical protein
MKYQIKLNQNEKEYIFKKFPKMGHLLVMYVEKWGNPKDTLDENIDLAYDFILQDAE